MVVAVRLGNRMDPGEVRWRPPGGARQQLGERAGGGAYLLRPRVSGQQSGDLVPQHGGARGFKPDDRQAGPDRGIQGIEGPAELPARAIELAGGDPGQAAADGGAGSAASGGGGAAGEPGTEALPGELRQLAAPVDSGEPPAGTSQRPVGQNGVGEAGHVPGKAGPPGQPAQRVVSPPPRNGTP